MYESQMSMVHNKTPPPQNLSTTDTKPSSPYHNNNNSNQNANMMGGNQQSIASSSSPTTSSSMHHQQTHQHQQQQQQQQQQHQLNSGPQQFCLRWNNYQTNLTNVFDQLLQNESFVDVTLACDGNSLKAHKMVLSACSPYFQGLLYENPCQHPIIIMKDVKWSEMKAIVEFMYKGEINVRQDQIGPLLKVADMLKIRGLTDVNADNEFQRSSSSPLERNVSVVTPPELLMNKKPKINVKDWGEMSSLSTTVGISASLSHNRKRRHPSNGNSSPTSYDTSPSIQHESIETSSPSPLIGNRLASLIPSVVATPTPPSSLQTPAFSIPLPMDPLGLTALHNMSQGSDDLEIKPGIAEMIREEERAKLLESSQNWLGASTSTINDSYQMQLQSMWQKCWNRNQNLAQIPFRERGPLKSWRPQAMADAIFSVLKDGLSLSQAARKYDIPYPTFVLYANRVHNMLGPSIECEPDLRPKGRGRPQRILLGLWPDEHIKGVIKTVVFRDGLDIKEEIMHYGYDGHHPMFPFHESALKRPLRPQSNGILEASGSLSISSSTNSIQISPNESSTSPSVQELRHQLQQQQSHSPSENQPRG